MAITNIKQIEINLKQFDASIVRNATSARQAQLALRLLTRLVRQNPVGDPSSWKRAAPPGYTPGKSKANWQVTRGDTTREFTSLRDTSGGATIAKGKAKIARLTANKKLGVINLQNNVKYIRRLNDGWSRQAPAGWIEMAVAEVNAFK